MIPTLRESERILCLAALRREGTIVGAANVLGLTRHAMSRRIKKHGIVWPERRVELEGTITADGDPPAADAHLVDLVDLEREVDGPADPWEGYQVSQEAWLRVGITEARVAAELTARRVEPHFLQNMEDLAALLDDEAIAGDQLEQVLDALAVIGGDPVDLVGGLADQLDDLCGRLQALRPLLPEVQSAHYCWTVAEVAQQAAYALRGRLQLGRGRRPVDAAADAGLFRRRR